MAATMRLDYAAIEPDLIARLRELTARQRDTALDQRLRALVELRTSQLNRCAYCIDLHAREALQLGESTQRLLGLDAWRHGGLFDERECAALGWAEALTTLGSDDEAYAAVRGRFSEAEIVQLTLAVALANAWNRIAGGFHRAPPPRPLRE